MLALPPLASAPPWWQTHMTVGYGAASDRPVVGVHISVAMFFVCVCLVFRGIRLHSANLLYLSDTRQSAAGEISFA